MGKGNGWVAAKASSTGNNSNEEFLEHKSKKKWVNESGYSCFMFYPRALQITWGAHRDWWDWKCFKEASDENIEVAKLNAVCWLDIRGRCKISDLSQGVDYEIACLVKLKNGAHGWGLPITLNLSLPDNSSFERQVSLLEKPKGELIELNFGSFPAGECGEGEVRFHLYEHGGHWKSGLIFKGAIIRPKAT